MQQTLFSNVVTPRAVTVYTDGGCDPNPGPGGWAAVICLDDCEVTLSGNALQATNNQMELEAAIAALAYLSARHGPCEVDLHTDSQYLRRGISEWIDSWFARRWMTKAGQPIKNQASWRMLYDLTHGHQVRWHWVQGHSGEALNERADRLARQARERLSRAGSSESAPAPLPDPDDKAGLADLDRGDIQATEISIAVSVPGGVGPGAWAAVLEAGPSRRVLRGSEAETTGNLLFLQAATRALDVLEGSCDVTVFTASDYLAKGAGQWVEAWRRRGWRTAGGAPVKHRAQWEALLASAQRHRVSWQVVRDEPLPEGLAQAKQMAVDGGGGDLDGAVAPQKGAPPGDVDPL